MSQVAYERLLYAIKHGDLPPGTRVRETEIAASFGISRTPVRDAMRRLETEGLLVNSPRQGTIVKKLEYREITDLYDIREILEGAAAQFAARYANEVEIMELEHSNQMMFDDRKDPVKSAKANRIFHQYLHHSAKNSYLIEALSNLSNSLTLLGGTTLKDDTRVVAAFDEHKSIIDAIKARDMQAADEAARVHIRNSQRVRIRMNLDVNS